MLFHHSPEIWRDFPELVPGVLFAQGITSDAHVDAAIDRFNAVAQARLAASGAGELPEIQAWRRAFSKMGLKPTQYRCASESLLRRFRKEGALPRLHPLVDLCNALSLAYAVPVAVFDVSRIAHGLEVRHARGDESYLGFSGETENPQREEVIFADAAGNAHARRWAHRQSAYSAVRSDTAQVLIVAEGLHAAAPEDVARLIAALAQDLRQAWGVTAETGVLGAASPRFEFSPQSCPSS
ncbi:MAG: hypothetical protein H0X13_11470 [Ramlibacter sp.]|nr:hypothetical protein [Ramlibacter sp.]